MEKFVQIADEGAMIVMGRYEQQPHEQSAHQSEAALEENFIQKLVSQGYERLHINNEADLLANLRKQLETLNEVELSDSEWQRLKVMLLGEQMGIEEKTEIIQHNNILSLPMDNGINRNICIIDRKNIHRNNRLQVLNQFEEEGGAHKTRYDVTILVNGLPLVHIELKKRGIPIKEAFNQINRYQRNSFWAGTGLYDYAQIFIISNGTETKYYSNTTRYAHVMEQGSVRKASAKRESNTFEFTSYWTDTDNNRVADLIDFAERFLNRKMLLYILTRYCVFTVDKSLMVMRPYQIAATEAILRRINQALNNRSWLGTTQAGGYIWHTTGSGKTLTSFKTAQLASMDERVKKVLFVVDRKDLDYQILTDFLITNEDRHLANMGILRDAKTLRFQRMAPIFDSGNSMFFDSSPYSSREALLNIEINSFCASELEMLSLVQNKDQIHLGQLPAPEDVTDAYDQIHPEQGSRNKALGEAFQMKVRLLEEFLQGSLIGKDGKLLHHYSWITTDNPFLIHF